MPGPGDQLPAILAAFGLGRAGRLSDEPVARGRLGAIWRLDTPDGSWAVKVVEEVAGDELTGILEGAAFQEAAAAAGVPTPAIRRTTDGEIMAALDGDVRVRVQSWVDLAEPALDLDAVALGSLVARLHLVPFDGTVPLDDWYATPVGRACLARAGSAGSMTLALRSPASWTRSCPSSSPSTPGWPGHRGRCGPAIATSGRTTCGGRRAARCASSTSTTPALPIRRRSSPASSSSTPGDDPPRARAIREAYAEAGGPGRVETPTDFSMAIAQLTHILEEGCRRWLVARTDADRADNEAWVREYLDRPLTREGIEALLAG